METPLQELKYLLETVQPKAVVSKTGYLHFFAPVSPENEYFNSRMEEAYRLVYQDQTDRIYIWVKKYE